MLMLYFHYSCPFPKVSSWSQRAQLKQSQTSGGVQAEVTTRSGCELRAAPEGAKHRPAL